MANRTRARAVSSDCWPQQEQERNAFAVKIPALLGILATHSLDTPVPGLKNLMDDALPRLKRGREAGCS